MLHQNILLKKKEPSILRQKGNVEFLITTFLISLLTILGIFMSHYNKDMFIGGNKDIFPIVISADSPVPSNKSLGVVSIEEIDATFNKNMDIPVLIFALPNKSETQ